MQKIPTIFVRDFANQGKITEEWVTWDPHQVLADLGVVQLTRAK